MHRIHLRGLRQGLFGFLVIVIGALTATAGVPGLISYQGQLNDDGGVPINATISFTFSIYDAPTGGTPLWTEVQTLPVSNGVFNVQLGAVAALPASLFAEDVLYLGIKVGADDEMVPRQRVTSSAYSQRAELGVPIGSITAWAKSMPGVPSLPDGWVECNGQTLSEPRSPLDGQTIPDLNGVSSAQRFLRGATSSGGTGGSESNIHTHTFSKGTYPNSQSGTNYSTWHGGTGTTSEPSATENRPPFFDVVWIMKIR